MTRLFFFLSFGMRNKRLGVTLGVKHDELQGRIMARKLLIALRQLCHGSNFQEPGSLTFNFTEV